MKKSISILLCCVLIFSCSSFVFADFGTTDSNNLSNIKTYVQSLYNNSFSSSQITNLLSLVSSIQTSATNSASRLSNIVTNTQNTANKLIDINDNILTLMSWLDPANGGSTNALLQKIVNALTYVGQNSIIGSWVADIWQLQSNNLPKLNDINNKFLLGSYPSYYQSNPNETIGTYRYNGSLTTQNYTPNNTPILGALWYSANGVAMSTAYGFQNLLTGFNQTRYRTDWVTLNQTSFTPTSAINGIYQYFSAIQTPVARLAYVLANDQEIEARNSAAQNQEAVVDNFIDSSGNGSASTTDFTSISSASNGFKTNFNSGASAGGIWDVFNSDHGNWFSQSIADSLDTSGSSNRLLKSGSAFETPLLDQQIEDIYKSLGVMSDD